MIADMNTKEMLLAASLLNDYSDALGNRGCNDWEFPADWTQQERIAFVREYHEWNGDPEEFSAAFLHLPDFAVAAFLSYKIRSVHSSV